METNIERANALTGMLKKNLLPGTVKKGGGEIYLGVDIGTANVVSVAVDEEGTPLAGIITPAKVTREGMIVDYLGAIRIVREQTAAMKRALECEFTAAMSAVPPGTEQGNERVTANILEAADLEVAGMIDEPEASALVLGIQKGVVVDVGGGTTGVSIIQDGRVTRSIDEPTGGFHFDLVIAGNQGISLEEAEQFKCCKNKQKEIFPIIRPVMEKVAAIVKKAIAGEHPEEIWLVGGSGAMYGFASIVEKSTGIVTRLPADPILTTPLGIAIACRNHFQSEE